MTGIEVGAGRSHSPGRARPFGSWLDQALCTAEDPELFFPDPSEAAAEALTVCGRCSVRRECLSWALTRRERYGVWGGTTERDREALYARGAGSEAAA
jgi:WhiB family transcriptional regulator, redox-sensing transcriptional regulator